VVGGVLINMLVTKYQSQINMKPLPLLKLLVFKCISVTSFMRGSTYPDILFNSEVQLKLK